MTGEIDVDKAPGCCGICGPLIESEGRCELHDSRYGYDPAGGADQTVETNYQLKDEGVEVASITDKTDSKNVRGDWFNPFGGGLLMRRLETDLSKSAKMNMRLLELVEAAQEEIGSLRNQVALLEMAARCAGDEIRDRKPEQHGAYWLTFPECSTSRGMYWATAWLLAVGGLLLAWWSV